MQSMNPNHPKLKSESITWISVKILLQNKWRTEKQKNKRLWSLQWLFVTVDQHQKFEFEQGMFIAWKLDNDKDNCTHFTAINYTDL
jgi:hypothetical protein